MRATNTLFLLRQHWRFHWASWMVVAGLVLVSACVITLIGGTAHAVNTALRVWTTSVFPPTVLTVRPETRDLGLLGFHVAVPQARITEDTLASIEAMPETLHLYPVAVLPFPTMAEASFLGEQFGTDCVVAGIDAGLVASEIAEGEIFAPVDWQRGVPIPVLLSSYFLDLYNLLYAQTISAPALSERTVIGYEFDLTLGHSVLGGALAPGDTQTLRCRIVGLTRNPQLLGITIPRQSAEEIQQWFAANSHVTEEIRVPYAFLEVRDTDQIETISGRLATLNLVAETPTHLEERVATLERLLTLASAGLQAIILGLTLFGCACLMTLQMGHRRPSMVFLHVSGVPRPTIFRLMVGEAGGVVLLAAAGGAAIAVAALDFLFRWLTPLLPASLPVPQLSPAAASVIAAGAALILAVTVTIVAVGVVALQHRQIGRRPVG